MERTHRAHALRIAVAAGLGLCLSLPLAAQDITQGTRLGNRANKVSTSSGRVQSSHAADQRFFDKTTKANEKEVAVATLAEQKASAPDVREFASRLLRDHQDMLVKLDETAVALGVATNRRYTAMVGWGSTGLRDGTQPHPAQDDINASGAGAGGSSTSTAALSGPARAGVTAAAGGNAGDELASSTGSAVGQGGTAGRAVTAAGGTSTMGTVTGRGTMDGTMAPTGVATQAVPASASNDPEVRKLAALSGEKFDLAFADGMIADHKKDIAEFERASMDKSLSEETRTLAANALPTLREHLAMAEGLRDNLKTSAN